MNLRLCCNNTQDYDAGLMNRRWASLGGARTRMHRVGYSQSARNNVPYSHSSEGTRERVVWHSHSRSRDPEPPGWAVSWRSREYMRGELECVDSF